MNLRAIAQSAAEMLNLSFGLIAVWRRVAQDWRGAERQPANRPTGQPANRAMAR